MTAGSRPLGAAYDVALLDLDGVVYIGGTPIPGAPEALQLAKCGGMRLAYVTNNASRTPAAIAGLLAGMNVPADEADVVTSAQAAARLLAERLPPGAKVLVIGATALRLAVRERGLTPVSTAIDQPKAVVQGYGPGIMYATLAEGGLAVRAGAVFVGTNADSTLPGPRGIQPGNGSLLQVIAHATGTAPVIAGKPEPPLHRESVIRTNAKNPLVVGDRLDTDIEAAHRAGPTACWCSPASPAPPTSCSRRRRSALPTSRKHSTPCSSRTRMSLLRMTARRAAAGRRCGPRAVTLALKGSGSAIDGLRALAAAAWQAGEGHTTDDIKTDDIKAALKELAAAGLPT